jgi:dipeptidyl aminopeptidase/acylaminoacyl peptidase
VAWVANARGARNIWVAEPPDRRGRPLTSFAEDDGQEISDLSFAPDGKSIVFVRGGDANRKGEIPNPQTKADGAEQAVFVVAVSGGAPRKLGEGHSAAVSPKGDRAAFVFPDEIHDLLVHAHWLAAYRAAADFFDRKLTMGKK